MAALPPIIPYVFRVLPLTLFKAGIVFASLWLLQNRSPLTLYIPTWLAILVSFSAIPLVSTVQGYITEHKYSRDAALNGAIKVPKLPMTTWQAISVLRESFTNTVTPIDAQANWIAQYGNTFRMPGLDPIDILTVEPSHIKAVLATQFDKFDKGPIIYDMAKSLLGDGIFNSDGDMWKFHRGMTRHFFTRDRVSDFENFEEHATAVISLMKKRLAEGFPVDFQDAIGRFTLDSATVHLYGKDVRSLEAGLPYPPYEISGKINPELHTAHPSNGFVDAFAKGQFKLGMRAKTGVLWRLFEPWRDELIPYRKMLNTYIQPLIDEGIRRRDAKGSGKSEKEQDDETLLDHLLRDSRDHKVLQDELINMLVAGRDTTAGTLSWAIYMLAENPNIVRRLREEIIAHVGLERPPTYDDLRSMKYLRAFVNETLRLFPSVPLNGRSTVEATILPGENGSQPMFVPAGSNVAYSVFIMHRRTDLWGPDALAFDPDRFLDHRLKKYLSPNPYIFVPFNAGPRICLGQQFAYNEMEFFLVRLLQSFSEISIDWKTQPDSSKTRAGWIPTKEPMNIGYDVGLTMSVKDALWVNMKEAVL